MLRIILIAIMLSGCATNKPAIIQYSCPIITLPPDPISPLTKLTIESKPEEVVKSWIATACMYRDWNKIVRAQIRSSR